MRPPLDWANTPGWGAAAAALAAVRTPAVVIDLDVVRANVAAGAQVARDGGVALHPHVKTHKSLRLATMQQEAGAAGLTAAKPSEAAVFLAAGAPLVTVAYPLLHDGAIGEVLDAAASGGGVARFVVDTAAGVEALAAVARRHGSVVPVFLEIDVGLHRCGVAPDGAAMPALAATIARAPALHFAGLLSHAGQVYGSTGPEQVRAIAAEERAIMLGARETLRRAGLDVPALSVGSTPTVLLNDGFDGIAEARPGNYVFMDLIQVALGVAQPAQVALQVLATVVTANARYAIVDAGSKVLSSDRAPHGADTLQGHGVAIGLDDGQARQVLKLSEEHGFVVQDPDRILHPGARVRIVPNHSCPVVNLAETCLVVDGTGAVDHWPVDARGRVQ